MWMTTITFKMVHNEYMCVWLCIAIYYIHNLKPYPWRYDTIRK